MLTKVQQLILVLVVVFIGAAGTQFLTNAVDVFNADWSTWQIVINSGIVAVVTYLVAWVTPQNRAFGLGTEKKK